jgi:hypothetical protein
MDPASLALKEGARRVVEFFRGDAIQKRFDEATEQVYREMAEVTFAVCKAFVCHLDGVAEPSDERVGRFFEDAVNDPSFPFRMRRLFQEATKTASHKRRLFLASVLYGLPHVKVPEDARDRVDLLVERLMPEDVELLRQVDELIAKPSSQGVRGCYLARREGGRMLFSAAIVDWSHARNPADGQAFDETALAAVQSFGCVSVSPIGDRPIPVNDDSRMVVEDRVLVTPLGRLLLDALEQVRRATEDPAVTPSD